MENISNTNNWNLTESEIITRAVNIVGSVGIGDTINANEYALARKILNGIIKSINNDTSPYWKLEEITATVPISGGNSYTLSKDIVDVEKIQVVESNLDSNITKLSRSDFFSIEDKQTTATIPTHFTIDRKLGGYVLLFYPTPSETISLKLLVTKYIFDSDTNSENVELPIHWLEFLIYELASKLSDVMHLDLQERSYLSSKAEELKEKAIGSYTKDEGTLFVTGLYDFSKRGW